MDVAEIVAQFITRVAFRPGEPLVVGVSGGPDSVCLLHALAGLRGTAGPQLVAAHFNHGIRGEEADEDQRFVGSLCAAWQVPLRVDRVDVPGLAERHKLSLEEAARRARYTFLARTAQASGTRYIAVGHNADDQAETVLMHFLRGSGLAGMTGMRPVSPVSEYHLLDLEPGGLQIVRPLLGVARGEIEAYCAEHGIVPRQDLSNLDTQYFRNRVRLDLLPELEGYNPAIRATIRRSAEVAAGDYEIVQVAAELAWKLTVRQETARGLVFDARTWRGMPLGLQRMLLRRAIARLRPKLREVGFDGIAGALDVAQSGVSGAKATLPGGLLFHAGYDSFTLTSLAERGPLPDQPIILDNVVLPITVPGRTPLDERGWELVARVLAPGEWDPDAVRGNRDEWQAFVDPEALGGPNGEPLSLFLRGRRPGDRFQPLGMTGTVRLTEFMINAKVSQVWRDAVPILAARADAAQIVWLCGLRLDERARVRDGTRQVLHFHWERAA